MSSTAEIVKADPTAATTPAPIMANEWAMIKEQAEILARTEVVPKAYRGKPDDIIGAALLGRELGFGLTTSLRLIDVIEGNPELNAEGKIALIRARGHSVTQPELNDERCVLEGTRADNGDTMRVEFTFAEAQRVQIPNWEWSPQQKKRVRNGTVSLTTKDNWTNYRQDMLFARCAVRLGKRLFGDVLQGMTFDRDELEAQEDYEPPAPKARPTLVRVAPVTSDGELIIEPEEQQQPAPGADDEIADAEIVEDDGNYLEPQPEPGKEASAAQLRYVEKLLGEAGIGERDQRHAKVGEIINRRVTTFERLNKREASLVIEHFAPKGS